MLRHRPPPLLQTTPVVDPIDGFFFRTPQNNLRFGSDRAVPVNFRPTLSIRRRDLFAIVLPATTKNEQQSNPHRYALADNDVLWQYKENRSTYLFDRYETVMLDALGSKIGVVTQNARMQIAHWLQRMWG